MNPVTNFSNRILLKPSFSATLQPDQKKKWMATSIVIGILSIGIIHAFCAVYLALFQKKRKITASSPGTPVPPPLPSTVRPRTASNPVVPPPSQSRSASSSSSKPSSSQLSASSNKNEEILAAVINDNKALGDLCTARKDDREFILAAVKLKGTLLQYASEDLQSDPEIALEAIVKDPAAWIHVNATLMTDQQFRSSAINRNSALVDYFREFDDLGRSSSASVSSSSDASESMDINEQLLAAVMEDSEALRDLCSERRNDREFIMAAVKKKGTLLQYANSDLQRDREVALEAIAQDAEAWRHVSFPLRTTFEFYMEAHGRNPSRAITEYYNTDNIHGPARAENVRRPAPEVFVRRPPSSSSESNVSGLSQVEKIALYETMSTQRIGFDLKKALKLAHLFPNVELNEVLTISHQTNWDGLCGWHAITNAFQQDRISQQEFHTWHLCFYQEVYGMELQEAQRLATSTNFDYGVDPRALIYILEKSLRTEMKREKISSLYTSNEEKQQSLENFLEGSEWAILANFGDKSYNFPVEYRVHPFRPGHFTALRKDSDGIWWFIDSTASRPIAIDLALLPKDLEIIAEVHPSE